MSINSPLADGLPEGTFVPPSTYDPLRHSTQDWFWYKAEPHFAPITEEDITKLSPTIIKTPEIPHLGEAKSKHTKSIQEREEATSIDEQSKLLSQMDSYPLSHRLVASMIDTGKGAATAAKPIRAPIVEEDTWIGVGDSPEPVRQFNHDFEERLRTVLVDYGLLSEQPDNDLVVNVQKDHWHLLNVHAKNEAMKKELSKHVKKELSTQAARREEKVKNDKVEIRYLESMMEKGGKRGKARFAKLLNQMHPNRNITTGDPISGVNKPGSSAEERTTSKKRKKKHSSNERTATKNQQDNSEKVTSDTGDNIASQIADIIWNNNNQATMDHILKEFVQRVPHYAGHVKEAKRRITQSLCFSKKLIRFHKLPDGNTYSATRV